MCLQQGERLTGQTLGWLAQWVAHPLLDDPIVVDERDASGACRRVEGERQHLSRLSAFGVIADS